MNIEIRVLGAADGAVLTRLSSGVFDKPIQESLARDFLSDPRHHIVVAIYDGIVVGFVSGMHYVHPDKPQGRGVGKALLSALFEVGRHAGCDAAWVLTDPANVRATRLYSSLGGRAKEQVMFSFSLGSSNTEPNGAAGSS